MHNIKKLGLILLCTFLVSSVGLTGIPKASAHGTVDQTDLAAISTTTVSSGSTLRQSFTPTANNLVAVDLRLSCSIGQTITVQILNPSLAQIGSSNALCSVSLGVVHFDYTPIALAPGNPHFISLLPGPSVWHASTSNPYPGGQAFVGGIAQPTTDFIFATYIQASPPPTILINDVTLAEGNSGTISGFDFTVTRSGDTTGTSAVNFATADGTATLADSDYASNSGLLTFIAGQTTKTVSVLVNGDTAVEPDEQFFVNLLTCVGCNFADPQGRGTITNDDSPPPPGQVTGQVNILVRMCGIAFVGGSVINYGDLLPGDTSAEKTLTLDNTGNTDANVALRGTHWLDGSDVNQMNVENTKFSTTPGTPYALKTPLSLIDQPIDVVDPVLTPATNRDMLFQLQANLNNPGFSGAATQTKIFTATC